jgi:hypothetical protein
MGQKPTPLLKPTQKIIFFFKATQKNAIQHCAHLSLPTDTQASPKAKAKECNRQRSEHNLLFAKI